MTPKRALRSGATLAREVELVMLKFWRPVAMGCLVVGALLAVAQDSRAAVSYTYDDLGRVTSIAYDDGRQISYSYDAAGNRTQEVFGGVNRLPVAVPDSANATPTVAVTIDVRANDSDPDGNPLSVAGTTTPTKGVASVVNNNVVYTANAGTSGADSFTYTISDGQGGSASAAINVTITAVNQPPVAVADSATATPSIALTINVRANDSDPDSDPLTVTSTTTPTKGVASIVSNNIVYTANAATTGTDTFNYTISDGRGGSATAAVNVTIAANQLPVAVADTATATPSVALTINVRANDSDPDSDPLTVTSTTTPTKGVASIVSNNVVYTANAATTGTDTFNYTISDGRGGSASAAVNVTITGGTNHPPVAVNDSGYAYFPQGTPGSQMTISLDPRTNDSDVDGNPLLVTAVTNGANGTVTIQGGGTSVLYQRTSLFPTNAIPVRTDSFTYTISDGQGGTATATVNVTIEREPKDPLCGGVPC